MVNPQSVNILDMEMHFSRQIVIACGSVKINDIVYLNDDRVGTVVAFWRSPGDANIIAQLEIHTATAQKYVWSKVGSTSAFVDSSEILDALMYYSPGDDLVRIIPPVVARFR